MKITREELRKTKENIVKKYLSDKELENENKKIKEKAEKLQKSLVKTKPVEGVFDE